MFRPDDSEAFERAIQESLREQDEAWMRQHNESEMKAVLDESELQQQEDEVLQAVLNESACESLATVPTAVARCHEISQLPLSLCVQAYSRYEPQQLQLMPLDLVVQDMLDWLLGNT